MLMMLFLFSALKGKQIAADAHDAAPFLRLFWKKCTAADADDAGPFLGLWWVKGKRIAADVGETGCR